MGSLTIPARQAIAAALVLGGPATRPATAEIVTFTDMPTEAGNDGTELAVNGAGPIDIDLDDTAWDRTDLVVETAAEMEADANAASTLAAIVGVGLRVNGVIEAVEVLDEPVVVPSGERFTIPAGGLRIVHGGDGMTEAWAELLADHWWRGIPVVFPTSLTARVTSTAPTTTAAGTTQGGAAYADLELAVNETAWAVEDGLITNDPEDLTWLQAPSAWDDARGLNLYDHLDRRVLFRSHAAVPIASGNTFRWPAGALSWQVL